MKISMKKIILAGIFGFSVLASPIYAMPQTIYNEVITSPLAKGIEHIHEKRFTDIGWLNLNIVKVDLRNADFQLKGLIGENGISGRATVTEMMNLNPKLVAAVNGDYFNYQPVPSSIGGMIQDGKLEVSPNNEDNPIPMFYMNADSSFGVSAFQNNSSVTNNTSGKSYIISSVNKCNTPYKVLGYIDRNFSKNSVGKAGYKDMVEVVVADNVVTQVRVNQDPVQIPENGYVISQRGESLKEFKPGDSLTLNLNTTPDNTNIKFAIGVGSVILKDGIVTNSHINIKGNHSRTAIGIDQGMTSLIMLTIDNRGPSFKGVSQELMGELMLDLGAYTAVNMDGGGSTTMVIREGSGSPELVNLPSGISQRKVVNGIGIQNNSVPGEIAKIALSSDSQRVFSGSSIPIKVKAYDSEGNPVSIDGNSVAFSVEGVDGVMEGNIFKPASSGTAIIHADYNGIHEIYPIEVLGEVYELSYDYSKLNLAKGEKHNFKKFEAKDQNGNSAAFNGANLTYELIGDIGKISENTFTAADKDAGGAIVVRSGNAVLTIPVSIGSNKISIHDFENLTNLSSSAQPAGLARASAKIFNEAKSGKSSVGIGYDFTKPGGTRAAYLDFDAANGGLKISGNPSELGLWIKSDGKGAWLRAQIKSADGEERVLDIDKGMTSTGWQFKQVEIPSDMKQPVSLQKIYVVETDGSKKYSGTILVDGLTAIAPTNFDTSSLPQSSNIVDPLKVSAIDSPDISFTFDPGDIDKILGYDASSTLLNRVSGSSTVVNMNTMNAAWYKKLGGRAIYGEAKYAKVLKDDIQIMIMESNGTGLRNVNSEQLIKMKSELENCTVNNIVVVLQNELLGKNGIKDTEEANLIHKWLMLASKNLKNVYVVQRGSSNSSTIKDGVHYITMRAFTVKNSSDINSIYSVNMKNTGNGLQYSIEKVFQK